MGKFSKILNKFLILLVLLINYRITTAGSNVSCIMSEKEALTKLTQGFTDEANWLASWTGNECCKWVGVGCDNRTGNVIKLDLRNVNGSGLGGEIRNSLLNLTHLQYLDLSMNDFSEIPIFLGSLTSLKYLNLSSGTLKGEIPVSIGNLLNLQYLDIRSNQLRAQSLSFLSKLSSLKYLDLSTVNLVNASDWLHSLNMLPSLVELRLSTCQLPQVLDTAHLNFTSLSVLVLDFNNFNSTIPTWLFNLSNLQHLDLSGNSLRGSIPRQLGNLKLLEVLVLSSNDLEGGLPDSFGNLCNLLELILDYNKLSGEISNFFSRCVAGSLRSLNLEGNSFNGSLPKQLGQLKQLRSFNAFVNSFQGNLPDDLGQLKNLEFLALADNSITGPIPASIGGLSSLRELYLSDNFLNGSIPESLGQLSNLQFLSLQNNSLSGRVSELHFSKLKSLRRLQLSINSLVFDIDPAWTPPFQLEMIDLSNNRVGPQFPEWLRTQKNATVLMMSNANISSSIPRWFTEISSGIQWLDLSNNLISGNLPELRNYSAPDPFRCIFLYSNNFQGHLPYFPFDVNMLDISNNLVQGEIPQNIGSMMPQLQYFRVSNNVLTGSLPPSICKMQSISILDLSKNQLSGTLLPCWPEVLEVLDLSYNRFTGQVPPSLGSLSGLQSLHLESNRLQGKIPESLKNLQYLNVLDLSRNALNGTIPSWIGESLSSLKVLNIQSNKFDNEIPLKLCGLSSLRILNLANNKLTGKIPPCFSNFSGMTENGIEGSWDYGIEDSPNNGDSGWGTDYAERIIANLKGRELQYSSTLRFLFSIDLSENKFVGNIPTGLMNLSQLQNLNLSGNNFDGHIPSNIGKLKSLESLDLSKNKLSGPIPPSISDLNFLSYLNLSHNNLSGHIPRGNQLQTLDDKSIYTGNKGLCGSPLQSCQDDQLPGDGDHVEESTQEEDRETVWFYCGLGVGFVAGLVGVCSTLYFKDSWRQKYFQFVDEIYNRIYVMIAVKINQHRRSS